MKSIVVDSSYWISLFRNKDINHTKAQKLAHQIKDTYSLIVTEDILKETLTVVSQRCGKVESKKVYDIICQQSTVLPSTRVVFDQALDIFFSSAQKNISVIDCEIAHVFKENHCDFILTFDPHFKSLGLTPLP